MSRPELHNITLSTGPKNPGDIYSGQLQEINGDEDSSVTFAFIEPPVVGSDDFYSSFTSTGTTVSHYLTTSKFTVVKLVSTEGVDPKTIESDNLEAFVSEADFRFEKNTRLAVKIVRALNAVDVGLPSD